MWRFGPFQLPSYIASPVWIKDLEMFPGFVINELTVN